MQVTSVGRGVWGTPQNQAGFPLPRLNLHWIHVRPWTVATNMVTLITEQLCKQSLEERYDKAFSFNVKAVSLTQTNSFLVKKKKTTTHLTCLFALSFQSLPAVGSSPTLSWSTGRSRQGKFILYKSFTVASAVSAGSSLSCYYTDIFRNHFSHKLIIQRATSRWLLSTWILMAPPSLQRTPQEHACFLHRWVSPNISSATPSETPLSVPFCPRRPVSMPF